MAWLMRTIIALVLAAMAGGAIALDRRRARQSSARRTAAARPPKQTAAQQEDEESDQKPLLSPTWFTVSHFSMLVVLGAMMVIGLAMHGIRRYPPGSTWYVTGGDVERGRLLIETQGCGGCHSIPGIREATGNVGPPLAGFAERMYIGGQLPNTPDYLVAWLQNPQRYAPGTAMPNQRITEPMARDMAAYLYSDP